MQDLQQMYRDNYSDMPFEDFVQRVHRQHYSDMPFDEFTRRAGIRTENQPMTSRVGDAFIGNEGAVRGDPAVAMGLERRRQAAAERDPNAPGLLQRMWIGNENNQLAAVQRATPDASRYGAPIATDAFQMDDGQWYYRDRATGQTTRVGQDDVLLQDERTRGFNVYARNPSTEEGRLGGFARIMSQGLVTAPANAQFGVVGATRQAAANPVVQAADRLGIEVPRAVASDNIAVQQAANVARNIPGAGAPLVRATEQAGQQVAGAVDDVARGLGASDPSRAGASVRGTLAQQGRQAEQTATEVVQTTAAGLGASNPARAGNAARAGIADWIGPRSEATVSRAYDAVGQAINPNTRSPLRNTQAAVAEIAAANTSSGLDVGRPARYVIDAVQRSRSFEEIKNLRTHVGEMVRRTPEGTSLSEWRRLYGALTDDLAHASVMGGGERGEHLWRRANDLNRAVEARREALRGLVNANSDEQVFRTLMGAAQAGGRANIDVLNRARRAMGPEQWREVAGTIARQLGTSPAGEFSAATFVANWGRLSPEGRNMLFGANTAHRRALDGIARNYQAVEARQQALRGLTGAASDEQAFRTLMGAATDGGRANIELLTRARGAVGREQWNEVAGTVVTQLGVGRNGEFSLAAFGTNWRGMSAEGRNLLFGSNTAHRRALEDIATVASRGVQFERFANPSGTARSVLGGGIGSGLYFDPLSTITGLAGTNMVARWLAQPATAQQTARWLRAYDAVSRSQTPARLNSFRQVSEQLARASGGQVSLQQFMQLIQSPRPTRAEGDQIERPVAR